MKILQFMDMQSTKFGGLGKFMIKLMERCPNDRFYFVFQNYPVSEDMVKRFEACGANIYVMNTATGKKALLHIPQFIKMIRRIKPDIVHFHFANSFFIYAPIAKLLGVKKMIKTQHCCLTTNFSKHVTSKQQFNLRTKIFSWNGNIYKLFNHIIMCSNFVQEQFENVYGKSHKYKTIYFGVEPVMILDDYKKIKFRKNLQISEDDIVITTVAFADPIKGVDVLIKAIPYIRSQKFNVVIVGINLETQYGAYLHELAKNLNVDEKIRWIGITDHVGDYLSISDIYCQPSRSEALGLAGCEAKSAKLPIVASNVGGLPEISNVLFENEDFKDLAKRLTVLLNDEKQRKFLAEQSYIEYENKFMIDKGVEEYANLYFQV